MLKWNRGVKPPSTAQTGRLGAVLFFLGLRPGSVLNDARRGCAPSSALLPVRRALRPSTPGDFLPDEKVTKESPRGGSPLGTPLGGHYHPPSNASVAPPRKGCHPMQLNFPEDAADSLPPQPIPLGQKAGGSKGARPPSPEVQEPGGSWRIFGDFLFVRKSPGARGGAPASREECRGGHRPPRKVRGSRSVTAAAPAGKRKICIISFVWTYNQKKER